MCPRNDRDFVDFWCSVYSGDLGKLIADIEDISWTNEELSEEPSGETEGATVALDSALWGDVQNLLGTHLFNTLSDLVFTALRNLVEKCKARDDMCGMPPNHVWFCHS